MSYPPDDNSRLPHTAGDGLCGTIAAGCLVCGAAQNGEGVCLPCAGAFAGSWNREIADPLRQAFASGGLLLEEKIGGGGSGEVWRAQDVRMGRAVAVKILRTGEEDALSRERRWRFQREIQILATLRHPRIAAVHECGFLPDGRPWFVMDLVTGCDLGAWQKRQPVLAERLRLFARVCETLHFAHRRGVLHLDLKPANVLVEETGGEPRLIDFGMSRLADGDHAENTVTLEGAALGTPLFMAPEQARGERGTLDVRTDVYALGALLLFLLTGVPPYDPSLPTLELMEAIRTRPPRRLRALRPELPRDLEAVVERAMSADRANRYESAAELGEEIQRFQLGQAIRARDGQRWYAVRKWISRNWRVLGAAAVVVLVTAGAGWLVAAEQTKLAERRAHLLEQAQSSMTMALVEAGAAAHAAGHPEWAGALAQRLSAQSWEWAGEGKGFDRHRLGVLHARLQAEWHAGELKYHSALPHWQKGVRLAREWQLADPDSGEARREVALALLGSGTALGKLGFDKEATMALDQAAAEAAGLRPETAGGVTGGVMLARGRHCITGGRWAEAEHVLREQPPALSHQDRAEAALLRARALAHLSQPAAGKALVEEALRALASDSGETSAFLAGGEFLAAAALLDLGEPVRALTLMESAAASYRRMEEARVPGQYLAQLFQTSSLRRKCAEALLPAHSGMARAALEENLTSLRARRDAVAGLADVLLRREIAASLRTLAEACRAQGDHPMAYQYFKTAANRYDLLARRFKDEPECALASVECATAAHQLRAYSSPEPGNWPDFGKYYRHHIEGLNQLLPSLADSMKERIRNLRPLPASEVPPLHETPASRAAPARE